MGSWSSGENSYKAQEIGEGEAMEQDLKWLIVNMEKREIKVRQSLMARLHPICDACLLGQSGWQLALDPMTQNMMNWTELNLWI